MPNSLLTTPVDQLREQAKRLEAALSVGLAAPTVKAVHGLRSSTRRVEAQIALLAMVKDLPSYKSKARKVQRRLQKLRRIAGKVRDCDVQQKLLKDRNHSMTTAAEAPAGLKTVQELLRERLARIRQRREANLVAVVDHLLPRLTRDTEDLLASLKSAEDHKVSVSTLLAAVERQMERTLRSRERGEEHLHDLRKAAKRARYQCEAMPGPEAAAMAKRLEQLQDAGGKWHDLLDLTTLCHRELGAEHPFSRVLEHLRDERLDAYLADLEDYRSRHSHRGVAGAKRKPPQRALPASEEKSRAARTVR